MLLILLLWILKVSSHLWGQVIDQVGGAGVILVEERTGATLTMNVRELNSGEEGARVGDGDKSTWRNITMK